MPTFESYGAVGDGVTDDRNAVYNALNSGLTIDAEPGAIYYIGSAIEITGKDINVIGGPAMFLFKNTANIKFSGTAGVNTTVKTNTDVNDAFVEVTNPASFVAGDLFSITTSEANSWPYGENYRNGELHEVTAVDGDKLYVEDKIWTAWITGVNTLKVVQFKPIQVNLKGIIFKYETPQLVNGGLYIAYAKNSTLDGVIMHDSQYIGIMIHYCYNTTFKNGTVDGANADNGYGLRFQCSNKSEVSFSKFHRNFKAVESSSSPPTSYDYGNFPNRNLIVRNSYGCGCGNYSDGRSLYQLGNRFVNTHGSSQQVIIKDNIIENCYIAFNCAGIDSEFTNNFISGKSQHAISFIYGKNHKVSGNTARGVIGQEGGLGGSFCILQDMNVAGNVEISNNDVETCQTYFIVSGGTLDANNVSVLNNTVKFADNATWVYSDKSRIPGVIESGNVYTGANNNETKD